MSGINIYVGAVDDFSNTEKLPSYVKKNVVKINNERVAAEKKAGYGLLNYAIEHMGIKADVGKCFLSETDKPLHNEFNFSISHSSGLVVVAVSLNGSVGVDIEPCEKREKTERIKNKILCENEKNVDTLLLWTIKEAAFKFSGKDKGFIPKETDTTKYSNRSVKLKWEEKEYILSVVSDDVSDARIFSAPSQNILSNNIL